MLGEMIQFDEHFFQMGWFNHQPDIGYIYIGFSSYLKCLPFGIGVKLLNTSDKNPGIILLN